jgi:hypothetical protein
MIKKIIKFFNVYYIKYLVYLESNKCRKLNKDYNEFKISKICYVQHKIMLYNKILELTKKTF